MSLYNEEFIVPRSIAEATNFTLQVCEHLEHQIGPMVPNPAMLQRARWVIMELNTNSIKHAGAEDARLHINYDGTTIRIMKIDTGLPLSLITEPSGKVYSWPLAPEDCNKRFDVSGDDMHVLAAQTDSLGTAVFMAREQNDTSATRKINEHFGLLIMALASDLFTYRHDAQAKENIFVSLIKERKE